MLKWTMAGYKDGRKVEVEIEARTREEANKLFPEALANVEVLDGDALDAENEVIEKAQASSSAQPIQFHKVAPGEGDFLTQARAKAAAEGISVGKALSALAKKRPDLYEAYVQKERDLHITRLTARREQQRRYNERV
jgi:hypothetical protein